uniref:Uncharacterized protein n=1 Tax=viral metagenome TaxID=1070528 RepID=A0A6C0ACW4_9ZZZZ
MVLNILMNEKGNIEIKNKENEQKLEANLFELMKTLDNYLDYHHCGIFDPNCKYIYRCISFPRKQCDDSKIIHLAKTGWEGIYENRSDCQDVYIFCKLKLDLTNKEKELFEKYGCSTFRDTFLNFEEIQKIKRDHETNVKD